MSEDQNASVKDEVIAKLKRIYALEDKKAPHTKAIKEIDTEIKAIQKTLRADTMSAAQLTLISRDND